MLNLFDVFCVLDIIGGTPPDDENCTQQSADITGADPDDTCVPDRLVNLFDPTKVSEAIAGTFAGDCPGYSVPDRLGDTYAGPTDIPDTSLLNPYFFTGRRLDVVYDDTGQPTPLYYYRARNYDPVHGRFLQRDPAGYVDGMNLYEYVSSSPRVLSDPTGRWGFDVHAEKTLYWAVAEGMKRRAALRVGLDNHGTDSLIGTGFLPIVGEQSRHFNRNSGGQDSRLRWAREEMKNAKGWCDNTGHWSPLVAARDLGRGLHSLQDWWAHGEYSSGNSFVIEPHSAEYDVWRLDAVWENGSPTPQGRAPQYFVQSYWFFASETSWPNWAPGTLRQSGTERDSRAYIREFLSWLRSSGRCECKKYFLKN